MVTMNSSALRILVAEDNRVLSEVIRFNLQRAGFDVTVASNGAVAIQQLQEEPFDLLITDYQMPEVNGEELCLAVRNELHLEKMPILLCTAKGLELDLEHFQSLYGVIQVIHKPFSMQEITRLVRELTTPQSVSTHV